MRAVRFVAEPGISDGRRMNRYRAASCITAPSKRLLQATNRAEGRRRRVSATGPTRHRRDEAAAMSAKDQQALDRLYAIDNVLTIKITMPQADWDAVRTE